MDTREFFARVRKTVVPRPVPKIETDVMGQNGMVWAAQATIYGSNWYLDSDQNLIEIYDAGAALTFRDLFPKKDKYAREGLYLRLCLAYRTTANAFANIRTFSGNHVTLPNSLEGAMYIDPHTQSWVTDDMTININSIYAGEKLWIQRVEWEWASKETMYEDELATQDPYLVRDRKAVEEIYAEKEITKDLVQQYLIGRIRSDEHFAKRCLALLNGDKLMKRDLVALYRDLEPGSRKVQ
jgi:hypothetical protein